MVEPPVDAAKPNLTVGGKGVQRSFKVLGRGILLVGVGKAALFKVPIAPFPAG